MKFRIRNWTTSFNKAVSTAEVKEGWFWSKIGHYDNPAVAHSAIETYKKNKELEGTIYL